MARRSVAVLERMARRRAASVLGEALAARRPSAWKTKRRSTLMCGIGGYTGPREAGANPPEGLARLEYRGYDSAGIALVDDGGDLFVEKKAGKLATLEAATAARPAHAPDRAGAHARGP